MKSRLIVVAGPNEAGKTTITEKLLRHEWMDGCTYINPDIIAQLIIVSSRRPLPIEHISMTTPSIMLIQSSCLEQ